MSKVPDSTASQPALSKADESATLHHLLTRGVEQILPSAESLQERLHKGKIRLYLGIDPTGNLLTLGHSVVLRKLQQFAELGHEVILLIGNGTVRIGDPTGRDSTRPTLTDEEIHQNFENWQAQASKVLDFSKIEIRYNGDWLDKLTYVDMIKLMAQTTAQQLLERDMFQERMKKGLPVHGHEMLYPLLQGYDSVVMDVDLELGGTDQTFNMLMGRQLQKAYNNKEKWVLATPIINGTDGRKMSKSYGNFIALTENPIDMYGKLMRISDEMILEYFTVLTDVADEEISQMAKAMAAGENPMVFKKRLAAIITEMYHNTTAAKQAADHFEQTVQNNELPADMPAVQVTADATVLEILKAALPAESNTNLRRLLDQGAVKLFDQNGNQLEQSRLDTSSTLDITQVSVLKVGKRQFFRLKQRE